MNQSSCLVVMYHYIRDTVETPFPEIKALSIKNFLRQLDDLESKFDIASYSEIESYLFNGQSPQNPCALLTFDDGFIDHYDVVYPILVDRKISGIFFLTDLSVGEYPDMLNVHKTHFLIAKLGAEEFNKVVRSKLEKISNSLNLDNRKRPGIYRYDSASDLDIKRLLNYKVPFDLADQVLDDVFETYIGKSSEFARTLYLKPAMIREMAAAGMVFGAHTKNHRVLSRLNYDGQRSQLVASKKLIQNLTGQSSVPFCYPYGHKHTYNHETVKILQDIGYSMAFNTSRHLLEFPYDDRYELPRYDTKDLPPFIEEYPNA